ncbi:hypothetical protein MMC19_001588 [Ptychographa xylographoides]|nr:hypothetical protein [Ptychographa xylographoides]
MSAKNIFNHVSYEQDPRWTAVDDYTLSHLHPTSRANHSSLKYCLENSRDQGLPDISSYASLGKFLALQCQIGNVKHALEVGTLGGYTAIWIASQIPDIHVTTVEVDPKHAEVARHNIQKAGLGDRVEVLDGPGLKVLPKLKAEIDSGKRARFGFVFIDADKENNWAYFDQAVDMSVSRACVCVDNMVRMGRLVAEEAQGKTGVIGARQVIENAGKDARVDAVVMQTVGEKNYDGFLMAVVK